MKEIETWISTYNTSCEEIKLFKNDKSLLKDQYSNQRKKAINNQEVLITFLAIGICNLLQIFCANFL